MIPDELPALTCSVRGCGRRLRREDRALVCAAGHAYDVSRRGYVNLLQPQDRRSLSAGDSGEATRARARLLDAGLGRSVLDLVSDLLVRGIAAAARSPKPVVVDLGCGTGHLCGLAAQRTAVTTIGFDLSVPAIQDAARRWPRLTWAVANVDRRIPLADGSADVICSVNARRHPPECARTLAPDGTLVVAVPAPDDLVELRACIGAGASRRPRHDRLIQEHAPWFELVAQHELRERHVLERPELLDLLRATYRGERHSAADRVAGLTRLEVTLAAEIFVFSARVPPDA